MTAEQLNKRVVPWSNGRDPSEFGWVVDNKNFDSFDVTSWNTWDEVPWAEDIKAFIKEDIGDGPYHPNLGMEIQMWLFA